MKTTIKALAEWTLSKLNSMPPEDADAFAASDNFSQIESVIFTYLDESLPSEVIIDIEAYNLKATEEERLRNYIAHL